MKILAYLNLIVSGLFGLHGLTVLLKNAFDGLTPSWPALGVMLIITGLSWLNAAQSLQFIRARPTRIFKAAFWGNFFMLVILLPMLMYNSTGRIIEARSAATFTYLVVNLLFYPVWQRKKRTREADSSLTEAFD